MQNDWQEKKKAVQRVSNRMTRQTAWDAYNEIQDVGRALELSSEMVLPCEGKCHGILDRFRAHVERRAKNERTPDKELEMLFTVLEILEGMQGERIDFFGTLVAGYKRQIEYWESQARSKSILAKEMEGIYLSESTMLKTLIAIHECKGNS